MASILTVLRALLVFTISAWGAPPGSEILSLPGWSDPLPSRMYSGYLIAGDARLFYIYIESETNPAQAPLTAWFNGGPGCSSLGGFLAENGPFALNLDGTQLLLREFRWSRFSNMLYFETPAGVGFSYNINRNYNGTFVGDEPAAIDNMLAIKDFFLQFPELESLPSLRLAGESYAGLYVPMLAQKILEEQDAGRWEGLPLLQSIAVGNGCSGNGIGTCSFTDCSALKYQAEFLTGLAYISPALKAKIKRECDWSRCTSESLPAVSGDDDRGHPSDDTATNLGSVTRTCVRLLSDAQKLLDGVNIYNVYATCTVNDGCANFNANTNNSSGNDDGNKLPTVINLPTSMPYSVINNNYGEAVVVVVDETKQKIPRRRTSGPGQFTPNSGADHVNRLMAMIERDERRARRLNVAAAAAAAAAAADAAEDGADADNLYLHATATRNLGAGNASCYVGTTTAATSSSSTTALPTVSYFVASQGELPNGYTEFQCFSYCDATSGIAYYGMLEGSVIATLRTAPIKAKINYCTTVDCNKVIACKKTLPSSPTLAPTVAVPPTQVPTGSPYADDTPPDKPTKPTITPPPTFFSRPTRTPTRAPSFKPSAPSMLDSSPVGCVLGNNINGSSPLPIKGASWTSTVCAIVCPPPAITPAMPCPSCLTVYSALPRPLASLLQKHYPSRIATCAAFECNTDDLLACPSVPSPHPTYSPTYLAHSPTPAPTATPTSNMSDDEVAGKHVKVPSAVPTLRPTRAPSPTLMAVNGTFKESASMDGSMLYMDDDVGPAWAQAGWSAGPQGCIDSIAASAWMMNPLTQAAIHARPIDFCWSFCNTVPGWDYSRTMEDETKEVYPFLIGRIDVLIYNGDVDDCVPYTDNIGWISSMNFTTRRVWHPWYYHSYTADDQSYTSQLGGYEEEYLVEPTYLKGPTNIVPGSYEGRLKKQGTFHFATIRGSGHMVPQDKPGPMFSLYSRFIGLKGSVFVNENKQYATEWSPTHPTGNSGPAAPSTQPGSTGSKAGKKGSPTAAPVSTSSSSSSSDGLQASAVDDSASFIVIATLLGTAILIIMGLCYFLVSANRRVALLLRAAAVTGKAGGDVEMRDGAGVGTVVLSPLRGGEMQRQARPLDPIPKARI